MRILFLTPQLPYPPRQGTSIRNYNLIAQMASRHAVDLLSFLAPGDNPAEDDPLHRLCGRIATVPQPERTLRQRARATLMSSLPDMALRLESQEMHELVQSWLRDGYDILQIEGIELAQYARHTAGAAAAPRTVFDDHNCEYLLQRRNSLSDLRRPRRWHAAAYSLIQWNRLRRYEQHICREAGAVIAVSEPDRRALQRLAPNAHISVVPNGVDIEIYQNTANDTVNDTEYRVGHSVGHSVEPDYARRQDTGIHATAANDKVVPPAAGSGGSNPMAPDLSTLSTPDPAGQPFDLVFTGKMDYRPNVDAILWFAEHVLPRITAQPTPIRLQIVGMNPHPRLNSLRSRPEIEITGTVPDILPYLRRAHAYVIPMRVGGGTRFKALEAMAAGKPIVSTALGVEGIHVQHGREMLIADHADEFAAALLQLIHDRQAGGQQARDLGQAAYAFVKAHYTWDKIAPELDRVYHNLCSRIDPQDSRQLVL